MTSNCSTVNPMLCEFCPTKLFNYNHCGECNIDICENCYDLTNSTCPSCSLVILINDDGHYISLPCNPEFTFHQLKQTHDLMKKVLELKSSKGIKMSDIKTKNITGEDGLEVLALKKRK